MMRLAQLGGRMKRMRYWLSFDLGLNGAYDTLYAWLDKQGALECGDNIATFKSEKSRDQLARELRNLLSDTKSPRVYLMSMTRGGKFVLGRRKVRAPWTGYAEVSASGGEDV
jgi:hypothetical protein